MDDISIQQLADVLSTHSYKLEALINILLEKNIFSKQEFNDILDKVMDKSEKEPRADEYVIEELKKKVMLK